MKRSKHERTKQQVQEEKTTVGTREQNNNRDKKTKNSRHERTKQPQNMNESRLRKQGLQHQKFKLWLISPAGN